ncbi:MAG: biopolymer transporter ExbD [Candidatus Omnitrophica bacterium]|nr:biopolymer transporter ExbD [Candidatus Omnitrophota bacterium]
MNILLVLLIFIAFLPSMVSSSGLSVEVPRVITGEAVSGKGYAVTIMRDNSIYFERQRVSFGELKGFFIAQNGKDFNVLIKADQKATVGTLAKIWDLCRDSGARRVSIATNDQ